MNTSLVSAANSLIQQAGREMASGQRSAANYDGYCFAIQAWLCPDAAYSPTLAGPLGGKDWLTGWREGQEKGRAVCMANLQGLPLPLPADLPPPSDAASKLADDAVQLGKDLKERAYQLPKHEWRGWTYRLIRAATALVEAVNADYAKADPLAGQRYCKPCRKCVYISRGMDGRCPGCGAHATGRAGAASAL